VRLFAQEHFASNLIRGRLLAIARDWDSGDGPALLLACLPGEAHDLGLIMFGILAARRGWRITFLGADTPLDSLHASIRNIQPALTVLVATTPSLLAAHADDLRRLTSLTRTAIAGVTDAQAASEVGAHGAPRRHSPGRGGGHSVEQGSTGCVGRLTPEGNTGPVMSGECEPLERRDVEPGDGHCRAGDRSRGGGPGTPTSAGAPNAAFARDRAARAPHCGRATHR
jgi:hypothetical protein